MWMGAVKVRIQTADKNNHNNPQVIDNAQVKRKSV